VPPGSVGWRCARSLPSGSRGAPSWSLLIFYILCVDIKFEICRTKDANSTITFCISYISGVPPSSWVARAAAASEGNIPYPKTSLLAPLAATTIVVGGGGGAQPPKAEGQEAHGVDLLRVEVMPRWMRGGDTLGDDAGGGLEM
jgi:hypothetical protein